MVSDKRAKYLQKRKKKLREKAALVHADAELELLRAKILRQREEMDALREKYAELVDEEKLSSRIVWLVEALFPEIEDVAVFQRACVSVILAWNVSVRGEGILPDSVPPEVLKDIRILAERKKVAFPEDHRFVAEHWWNESDEGPVLVIRKETS